MKLLEDEMTIFQPDDTIEPIVESYKARKPGQGDHPQGNEDRSQFNQERGVGASMRSIRARIKSLGKHLGGIINKGKSSPSGMPEGMGGIGVKQLFAMLGV